MKEVKWSDSLAEEVELDIAITDELKSEGQFRELSRAVQELRKKTGLTPSDIVTLEVAANDEGRALVEAFDAELKKASLLKEIVFKEVHGDELANSLLEPVDANGILFTIALEK